MKKNAAIIVIGPSGSGKSTLLDRAVRELDYLEDIITYTTRPMRDGESDGNPYHFIAREEFEKRIDEGFFVEWARVHDRLYGSSNEQFISAWQRNKVIIMDVDVQGAETIKEKYPQAYTIFIEPPNLETLRERVEGRDGADSSDIDLRMENAKKEMQLSGTFDASLINDDYDTSFALFKKMIEEYLRNE